MGNVYIFVAAAAIAVISISFIFKLSMDTIKEYPEEKYAVQTKFFIWLGVSEVIPLILIVFGFMNLDTVATIEDLYIPGYSLLCCSVLLRFSLHCSVWLVSPKI
jgi:F0F1-type ATP synthase membrane subunit c/vacuolar-type H+-ATPase subunit K